jgi:hypothetical protein
MGPVDPADAIEEARRALGLAGGVEARAWLVERLDRPGERYHLIAFGSASSDVAVATVDARGGQLLSSARLPGTARHLATSAADALDAAQLGASAEAKLVWQPCQASRSAFYPLWQVSDGTRTVYVDQGRRRWDSLQPTIA